MGKRAALLLTGALVEVDRLEGQEWGHQGSTGDSSWEPLIKIRNQSLILFLQLNPLLDQRNQELNTRTSSRWYLLTVPQLSLKSVHFLHELEYLLLRDVVVPAEESFSRQKFLSSTSFSR